MQGKRTATATAAQRTADHGDQKGEVNMTTPNTGDGRRVRRRPATAKA